VTGLLAAVFEPPTTKDFVFDCYFFIFRVQLVFFFFLLHNHARILCYFTCSFNTSNT